jgi:DNA polymerase-3 subunit alpha
VRDEKAPQIVANEIKSIETLPARRSETPKPSEPQKGAKLYLRVARETAGVKEKLRQLLTMFEGESELILYFADTGKKYRLWCLMHDALIDELSERFGEENVVIK